MEILGHAGNEVLKGYSLPLKKVRKVNLLLLKTVTVCTVEVTNFDKTSNMTPQRLMRLSIWTLVFMSATFASIAQTKKVSFNTSTVVPGAEGNVKVKKDKNNNFNIEISIENLAEPKKLTPAKKAYVVWLDTQEKGTKNIGQVNPSSSMFSKLKKASITTVSPYKPVKIYVTAEDDPGVDQPGTVIVLTTDSF